jgi:hypothetical protein
MTNEELGRFFNTTGPFIQGNPNLRDPQVEGWFRTRQHFRNSGSTILQIPVGCGKTGLMIGKNNAEFDGATKKRISGRRTDEWLRKPKR